MITVGFWLHCYLTVWLYHPALKMDVPYSGTFECQILEAGSTDLPLGVPQGFYVDCTRSIGWLDTKHPNKFWTRRCHE